jgi:hypothetical protein
MFRRKRQTEKPNLPQHIAPDERAPNATAPISPDLQHALRFISDTPEEYAARLKAEFKSELLEWRRVAASSPDPRLVELNALLDQCARERRLPRAQELPWDLLTDDELYPTWCYSLPWVRKTSEGRGDLYDAWANEDERLRFEQIDHTLRQEVERRLPAAKKFRNGWELVESPPWDTARAKIQGSDGGNLRIGDRLYLARCKHGVTMPPKRGGGCMQGCRVSLAVLADD